MYALPLSTTIATADACVHVGIEIARYIQIHDIVALHGAMGVGKTTLAKGIIRGLGITELVESPTFTIIKKYEHVVPVYHVDLYRVHETDIPELGLEDILCTTHITIIEWPEKALTYLPSNTTHINLSAAVDTHRVLTVIND